MRLILHLICFSLLLTPGFAAAPANAAPDWQVDLWVGSGTSGNRLVLGADDTATDGYDNLWDTGALLEGQIKAYFPHPDWDSVHKNLHRDIRATFTDETKEWLMTLESTFPDNEFTVRWDLSYFPDDYQVRITDESVGLQTDMRTSPAYDFLYAGMRSFTIAVTASPPLPPPVAGDVNADGEVNIADVILVLRMSMELDEKGACADIDSDGAVNIEDVILTLRIALNLDFTFPCMQ